MIASFLRTGAFLLLAIGLISCASKKGDQYYLLVGTYTGEGSEGVYVYKFNPAKGSVDSVSVASGVENPSYLAVSPDQSNVYAVNEMADSSEAAVSSFSFDQETGQLTFLNKQSSGGGAPCYVSVDETGKSVFVGNYLGGSFSLFPVNGDGSLDSAKQTIRHEGSSLNKNRQSNPHVHCAYVAPNNKTLIVNDLGTDRVKVYPFDADSIALNTSPADTFAATPGAGPRHITFHPNEKFAYLVTELNGTVVTFTFEDGHLQPIQTISTLPENYEGEISGADIHVSPDGKFLYASNREDLNNIVVYKINQENGKLEKVREQGSGGVHPRNFMIDPTGQYLLVANRNTDNIVIFKRDKETGMLTKTGREIAVSQPVCLKMVPVK